MNTWSDGMNKHDVVSELDRIWRTNRRWQGITRSYTPEDVYRLRGTLPVEHTLASHGAARLWKLKAEKAYRAGPSARTGKQAVQEIPARPKGIFISRRQGPSRPDLALTDEPCPSP